MPILSILDAVIIEANGGGTQSLLFDVLLSEAAATDVFVDFQTIGGTAFQAVDFSDASGRLTIASGDTSGTITVFVASGSEIEADESFVLELTNPVGAEFASGSVSLRSAGTILDNDGTGNKLALFVDDVRVVEGDSGSRDAVFLVRLSQDPGSSVTLDFVTTDGSAVSGEDYQATSGSLTFLPGGSLVQEVRVPVFGDLSVEGSETFSLSFAPSGALANGASGSSGVATLLDDDAGGGLGPVLSVSGSEIVEADGGGTRAMEFVVTLSEASASDVEVDYQTISGSAKESIDVVRTSGTLTIAAGETSGVISISAFSASEDEADESFTLELTNVEGAVFAGDAPRLQATGTILDNDGTGSDLALFVGDAEVVEGASGTRDAVFEVRLSRPSDTTVSLSYTTRDGTARSGEDYASSVGIVTFLPGETVKAVSVAVFGDGLVEGTESFSLVFAPTAEIASGVADSSGLGTILDDDAGSGLAPVVSLSAAEVVEADGGGTRPIDFVVRLSEAATSDVVVDYQTISGTAKEAVDVVQTLQSGQLIIAAGETSGVISISTFGASEIEADESFVLELTNVQGAVFAGDALALSSRGIILDNDSGDPVLALTVSDAEVVEGASGTREAVFEVHLSRPVDEAVTVAYTTSPGTASTGSDFEGTSGTLTFLPGQTVAAVFVPVFGDGAVEGSEIFSLALSAPQGGLFGSGGAGAEGVGVILDDDAGGGDPVISIGPAEIVEANGGGTRAIDFVVRLSAPSTDPVRVDYATLDGTAVVGEDYVAETGTLTFAPGQTSAVVQVATSSGNIEEPDETFTLRLSNAVNGSLAGGVTELDGTGTILDNDGPAPVDGLPVLSVSDIQVEEAPGGSVATFTLVLSSPSAAAVSGSFSVEAGTASAGADFTPVSGAFLIASGDTTTTVDVAILEDGLVEPAETFVLRLTDPQNAQFAGRQPELIAIGEITDGTNQAPIAVADAFVTDEDSAFGGDVLADNGSGADSDPDGNPLTVTKVNGDAAAVGNQVVLGTGALLTLNADGTFDYDPNGQFEGLQVGQSAPDSFTYEISDGNGGTDTATVNVTVDGVNDVASLPILSILDAVIIEANGGGTQSLLFDVLLSEAAATDVFVDFQTIGGTAFQAVDFSDASGRLTIASGDTSGTITVFVASGSEIEADESFVLELTNPVGAEFASGSVSLRSAGTILDNDGTGNKLALFVDDVRVVEGDSGSRDAVFLVRLSQDPGSSVTLDFVTTDGSAVSGEDYQATSGSLTFLPGGSLVQEVRVPVFGDLSVEGSETFSLSFAPSGALANGASGSSGVATLLDDDAGGGLGPVLSVSGSEIVEADGGGTRAMEFVVTLSEASASDVEVDYQTISGSAKESIDVVRTSGTLTIAAGETSGVISISAFSASEDEADESFTLELTNVEGAVFAGDAPRLQATGTILDNDGTGSDLALFVGDAEVVEGASGTRDAVFEVRLSRPSDTTVSLSYTTRDGTARSGEDYASSVGIVTFLPGETVKAVSVAVFGDGLVEGTESFSLVFAPTAEIASGVADSSGLGTILDDDAGSGLAPVVSLSAAEVVEADGGGTRPIDFVVRLSEAATSDVVVDYQTISGTAKEAVDVVQTLQSGQLIIAAGETSGVISISTFGASEIEADESFVLELTNVQGAVFAGDALALSSRGIILDNDSGDPVLALTVSDAEVVEGASGTREAVFEVHLSRPVDEAVTVAYTTSPGTASTGSDFEGTSGTLTFLPGQTVAAVFVPVFGDGAVEGSEIFSLALSAPQGGLFGSGGAGAEGVGVILDDDAGGGDPVISIGPAEIVEANGGGTRAIDFVVRLSAPSTDPVRVDYATLDGTAVVGEDYVAETGTLTFAPGQTSAVVQVATSSGNIEEPDETFTLRLSNAVNGSLAGGVTELDGTGTILDNDGPAPVDGLPVLSVSDIQVEEAPGGSVATFTLVLSSPSAAAVSGSFSVEAGTASAGADFTPVSGAFLIASGDTTTTVDVAILEDGLVEPAETFVLRLTDPQNAQFAGRQPELIAIGEITDGTNQAPIAVADAFVTDEDSAFGGDVLADNGSGADSDPDGNPLTVTKVNGDAAAVGNQVVLGTGALLTLNADGTFDYDPNGQFEGLQVGQSAPDSFTYEISDGNGGTDTATVNVTVDGVNDDPVAGNDGDPDTTGYVTDEDTAFTTASVLTNDTDVDAGDVLSVSGLDTTGTAGLVTDNGDGTFNYDPNGQFEGLGVGESTTASFSYTVSDGNGGTDTATVTVTIDGVNDDPVATDDDGIGFTTDEDTAFTTASVLPNDSDPDVNDTLSVIGLDTTGTIGLVTDNGDGTFDYDPNGQFEGLQVGQSAPDSFTYEISDGNGGTDTATVTVTIDGVNDAPDAVDDAVATDADLAFGEDDGARAITADILGNDSDPDIGDPLTVTAIDTTGTTGLATLVGGVVSYDPNGAFESLAQGTSALDTFTYTISDGNGGTDTATVTVTVNGVNDDPTATDDSGVGFETDEDTAFTTASVLPNDSDPDATDTLSVIGLDTTGTTGLVTDNGDGTFDYDPNGQFESLAVGESATDTFSYEISDGNGGTDTATVTITIDGVTDIPDNIPPVAMDDSVTTDEDTLLAGNVLSDNGAGADSDPDGNPLTVTKVNGNAGSVGNQIVLGSGALLTLNADGTFDYDPNGQFEGLQVGQSAPDSFTYEISDGNGGTDTATVNVTVDGVNDDPVATDDDNNVTTQGRPIAINVLGNDTDVDSSLPDSPGILAQPSNGLVLLVDDGEVLYIPDSDFLGSDGFSYEISDSEGGTGNASVSIEVEAGPIVPFIGTDNSDLFFGTNDGELIVGADGMDRLFGNGGDDVILGGDSTDFIFAGAGNDIVDGGGGLDLIFGGSGEDLFVVGDSDSFDLIRDFEPGVDSVLLTISDLLTSEGAIDGSLAKVVGVGSATLLQVDVGAGFQTVATLFGASGLELNDLLENHVAV